MQTVVYILLLLLGVVLMVIAVRSLKNLRRNHQQWQFIQIQSNLFDKNLFEEYQNVEQNIIRHLKKYIPIIANFALLNGVISILGSVFNLLNININNNFNLTVIGFLGVFILFVTISELIFNRNSTKIWDKLNEEQTTTANRLYQLYINYFNYEYNKRNYLDKKQIMPYDYEQEFNYQYLLERLRGSGIYAFPISWLFAFHIGLFLFLIAFFLDKNFYQMIMFS
ncbi:MAG: hypothetical protein J6U05_06910 [Neisseriaceae bacterium]|nr:hypothetical protein [Neisseriaceae bacterium]